MDFFSAHLFGPSIFVSIVVITTAWLIYATRHFSLRLASCRDDVLATQSTHTQPTPRLAGFAIVAGLIAASYTLDDPLGFKLDMLWLCAAPLILAGALEDLGFRVRPALRFAAAIASSTLVIIVLGRWLTRLDIPLFDIAMHALPFAWGVTIFASTALSHSFNLIDGLNGLCLGVGLAAAACLAAIASAAGDAKFAQALILVAFVIACVLPLNFPKGRVFLGDTGAYVLGFTLSWIAILMAWRVPEISAWALLLTVLLPVLDTVAAIMRRLSAGVAVAEPDKKHLHHLVLRFVEERWVGRGRLDVANPFATVVMTPFFLAPAIAGAVLWNDRLASFIAVVFFTALYYFIYTALARASALSPEPVSSARPAQQMSASRKKENA